MNNSKLTMDACSIEMNRNLIGMPFLSKEEKERVRTSWAEKARRQAEEAAKSPEQREVEGWDL